MDYERNELIRKHLKDLVARGKNARGVADILIEEGIRGDIGSPRTCAIAVYLNRQLGITETNFILEGVRMGKTTIIGSHGQRHPYAIRAFVNQFDKGAYPELIKWLTGPVVP